MLADNEVEGENVAQKYLETQHWLELIDGCVHGSMLM